MTDKQPEALIRADELEAIGAESSLARTMAAHTIRLLYKENEALRAALTQPEQEPVAWMHTTATGDVYFRKKPHDKVFNPQPVYTVPPQREWVGLTDEEKLTIVRETDNPVDALAATEAKLKEKNHE